MDKIELTTFIQPSVTKGGMPVIEIPPDVADHFLGEANKQRMVITFDNGVSFHRALQRNRDGFCFMVLGKSTLRDAKKEPGTDVKIILKRDTSKYGMPMTEEFEEVLRQDDEGAKKFEALTPGQKRSLLYYISTAKTVDTRIRRSLDIAEMLRNGVIPR